MAHASCRCPFFHSCCTASTASVPSAAADVTKGDVYNQPRARGEDKSDIRLQCSHGQLVSGGAASASWGQNNGILPGHMMIVNDVYIFCISCIFLRLCIFFCILWWSFCLCISLQAILGNDIIKTCISESLAYFAFFLHILLHNLHIDFNCILCIIDSEVVFYILYDIFCILFQVYLWFDIFSMLISIITYYAYFAYYFACWLHIILHIILHI
jgi:hypothetical protein